MVLNNKYLIFCKSKVFLHPSHKASDNVPGFLLITLETLKSPGNSDLYWIPETELSSSQMRWLLKADELLGKPTNSITLSSLDKVKLHMDREVLNEAAGTYLAFSFKIASLYSIEFRKPSPSGWWYGSVVLHKRGDSINRQGDTLPVLFFHDDLCQSTILKQKELNKSFDPFTSGGDIYWGGIDFRIVVKLLVDLQRTLVDSNVWLVDASLDDLRNFSAHKSISGHTEPHNADDNSGNKSNSNSIIEMFTGNINKEALWNQWEKTKWGLMSSIATATSKANESMVNLIKRHPIVKLVEKNKDNAYVRSLLNNPKVQEIQNDFDSARVYLAKWSLGVKEEANKYKLNNQLDESYRQILVHDMGFDITEDTTFTEEEINRAMERNFPLTRQKWESLFDNEGRLSVTVGEVKDFIFHGGIDQMSTRKLVWPFLLNMYPWDSSIDERRQIDETLKQSYREYMDKWHAIEDFSLRGNGDEDNNNRSRAEEKEYWDDQVFRIEKDVKRNDRNLDLYKWNTVDGKKPTDENGILAEQSSPSTTADGDNEGEVQWEIKNPHLLTLKRILITYNVYNPNLGYVQGMADLLSPIYYILQDEVKSFWCFVNLMDKTERNFLRDQSGIRDQMVTLSELTQLMLPQLSEHLDKCDSSNLFFCFRMLLVWFKREFEFEDVCSIWEILFTDYYSSQYQIFFMLAILQKNSQPIIQNFDQFDQVLKYFNDLHNTMDWKDLMIRSELLFIRFQKLMSVMERVSSLDDGDGDDGDSGNNNDDKRLPHQSKHLQLLLSTKPVVQREKPRPTDLATVLK